MNEHWLQRKFSPNATRIQDHRSPFQRDRARILHSAAFRRLQAKTQVMGVGVSDFYRTRLTHSLEAAQIGSGISAQLRNKHSELAETLFPTDDSLIEAICLAHDIGHPPFGHGGEVALNFMMHKHGGFEGNGQTFRIVSKLEPYTEQYGMDLTRRTLLGFLKYPQTIEHLQSSYPEKLPNNYRQLKAGDWHPPKGVYDDDLDMLHWVLEPLSSHDKELFQSSLARDNNHKKTRYKSLDCSIMELADDIAYGVHDMEDAIVTGVVSEHLFVEYVAKPMAEIDDIWVQENYTSITENLFSQQHHLQKDAIGSLVNYLITSISLVDLNETQGCDFDEDLLRYNAKLSKAPAKVLGLLKDFVYRFVIKQTDIQRLEYKGQQIVMELFEAFASDPQRLLPDSTRRRWQKAVDEGLNPNRVIADYLSGMTDEFATRVYNNLFIANASGVNEKHCV
ncbi:deoxyguanosinetriphosphate triphosphohydrolase family protein [Thalassotalea litorea]|uniref:Deoxyguanosinetriphosphate triphosphohydrolase-like protein n=1 Tax=Thalassotalea litorea TaxID=2020715 RepID=A0A5R9IJ37_9GAMM|nr:anti-phage deoxyguanosine triphosphatase [Thalassotalea litorea]TLU64097.1 deoxyguanosinetriphosphate triphosphohydrolase family protein [Thalassotalea litorea]